jgi:class 3 adenylate cyclase/CheY-like chemotaxis protein
MREQRRLAAIVSADVAGYSRLMGRDESGTLAALKMLRRELIDPRIEAHGGRIVKTTGDGMLLEFPSVVDAVRCVVEVQTAIAAQDADVPEGRRIAFRVGVNLGDVIIDGDDIFGDGVNVAARLQEIAPPGGVCVSSRVHDDVRDRLAIAFVDGGSQALKNIARPIQVWHWSPGDGSPAASAAPGMKVLIVDDHALIREALRGIVKELTDDAMIFEASDSKHGMRLVDEHADIGLVLLDLNLPDRSGFDVLTELRERYPAISTVVLSASNDRDTVAKALGLGALGFIPKSSTREVMLGGLRLVLSGGMYIPPDILGRRERM